MIDPIGVGFRESKKTAQYAGPSAEKLEIMALNHSGRARSGDAVADGAERPGHLEVELPLGAQPVKADLLSRAVATLVDAAFQDETLAARIRLIVRELVGNADQFGDWASGDPEAFRLSVKGSWRAIRVEVVNPVCDGAASLKKLVPLVDWIRRFPSPRDAYLTRTLEVANHGESSGVGLVRLAHAANCQLGVDLVDGGRAVVLSGTVELAVERAQETKDLERLRTGDLPELEVEVVPPARPGGPTRLQWRGRACHERPVADFEPMVRSILARDCPGNGAVTLDLSELEDLSATSAAVLLLAAHQLLDAGREVVVVHDPQQRWQQLSFEVLRTDGKERRLSFEAV